MIEINCFTLRDMQEQAIGLILAIVIRIKGDSWVASWNIKLPGVSPSLI